MIYELSFRDESRDAGGPVLGGRLRRLDPPATGRIAQDSLATEPRIVFITHGFNVNLPWGRDQLARFTTMLPDHRDIGLVTVLWPGDHGLLGGAGYVFEGRDADDTAVNLARYIADTVPRSTPISFVSHSLGGRVVLGAMNRLKDEYAIEQVCVMAAAVDDSSPADVDVYRPGVVAAQRLSVLSSKRDKVLTWLYPLGDLIQAFIFFWRDEAGLALGWHGPRTARGFPIPGNVEHQAIPKARDAGHGDYLPPPEPTDAPNAEQLAAASYVNAVLAGKPNPPY